MDRAELERRGWAFSSPNANYGSQGPWTLMPEKAICFIESYADARVRAAIEEAAKRLMETVEEHLLSNEHARMAASIVRALKPLEGDGGGG